MSNVREFETGDIALIKETSDTHGTAGTECVILSGPVGPSKFYKVSFEGGKTDHFAERELICKPQQKDRLQPVEWNDCAWIPEILR